jgi:uncharacterized lipoprotein YddW (UPF0748 family)
VLRGSPPGQTPAQARTLGAAVEAVEKGLDRVGIPHRRLDDGRLSDEALRPFDVIVLPDNELSQAALESLSRFLQRGGRWVTYATKGPAGLDGLLGLQPGLAPQGFAPRALLPEPRPGMPDRVPIERPAGFRAVVAASPDLDAGKWGGASGVAAMVQGPYGYYVNMLPGRGAADASLLLAMVADLDPELWETAARATRAQAVEAVRTAAARWARVRSQPELSRDERQRIDIAMGVQRGRLPAAEIPSTEVEANRALLADRVQSALRMQDDLQQLCYTMAPPRKGEVRGIWIHTYARTDWDAVMRKVRDAGLNSIFVRVGRGGNVIYPSQVLPPDEWAASGPDELQAAISAARKYGIAFHAWRVNFHMGSAPKAFYDKMAAEDRLVRDPDGKQGKFLNPGDPRNQEQELQSILELVRKYDIDGFQFDYIRYPEVPHYDWDYGPVSRREFEKASGKPVEKWPADVISGPRKIEYEDWERENVNHLVERVHDELKKLKPWVQISAAVWRNHRRYRAAIKQDWPLWAERGWVDFLVPMDYTPEHDTLTSTVQSQVSAVRGRIPLVAGLGSYLQRTPMDTLFQVESARSAGADGFLLFAYNQEDIDEVLSALRAGATSEGTWPAYLAPKVEWSLVPGLEQKDAPTALALGERGQIDLKVASLSPTRVPLKDFRAELRLEDPDGRLITSLGAFNGSGARRARFETPAGIFRPVLRGNLAYTDGTFKPFVVRGPLCEGLGTEEMAALRARETPPVVRQPGPKVAVYDGGLGATALVDTLLLAKVNVFPLYRLQSDHLAVADVLILPQLVDVAELTPQAIEALRAWVSNGGTLLLTHDAVGARWHPRLFPEIGVGGEFSERRAMTAATAVGAVKAGDAVEHAYVDHVRIVPAQGAEVLLREAGENGAAVAVSGKLGKGRVVLYGAAPGYGSREMGAGELALVKGMLALGGG